MDLHLIFKHENKPENKHEKSMHTLIFTSLFSFYVLFILILCSCSSLSTSSTEIVVTNPNQKSQGFYTQAAFDSGRKYHDSKRPLWVQIDSLYLSSPCMLQTVVPQFSTNSDFEMVFKLSDRANSNCAFGLGFTDTLISIPTTSWIDKNKIIIWGYGNYKAETTFVDAIKKDTIKSITYSDRLAKALDTLQIFDGSYHDTTFLIKTDSLARVFNTLANMSVLKELVYTQEDTLIKSTKYIECAQNTWYISCPNIVLDTQNLISKDTLLTTIQSICLKNLSFCPVADRTIQNNIQAKSLIQIPIFHWVLQETLPCSFDWNRHFIQSIRPSDTLNPQFPRNSSTQLNRELFSKSAINCSSTNILKWDLQKDSVYNTN